MFNISNELELVIISLSSKSIQLGALYFNFTDSARISINFINSWTCLSLAVTDGKVGKSR